MYNAACVVVAWAVSVKSSQLCLYGPISQISLGVQQQNILYILYTLTRISESQIF